MISMIAKNSTYANRTRLASSLAAPSTVNFNTPTAVEAAFPAFYP